MTSKELIVIRGGVTRCYVWDLRNRMTGIDSTNNGLITDAGDFNYAYDFDGVRISESTRTSTYTRTTYYLNDPQNPTGYAKAIEERAVTTPNSGSVTTTYRSFALGQKVEAQADATNGVLYLMTDGHGSTRALISTTGDTLQNFDYDAFGTPIGFVASNAKTPWLFGGDGLYDPASKFTYHLARWRDGFRFISYDSFEADPASPAALHKYLYASSDPLIYEDASGHSFAEILASFAVRATVFVLRSPTLVLAAGIVINLLLPVDIQEAMIGSGVAPFQFEGELAASEQGFLRVLLASKSPAFTKVLTRWNASAAGKLGREAGELFEEFFEPYFAGASRNVPIGSGKYSADYLWKGWLIEIKSGIRSFNEEQLAAAAQYAKNTGTSLVYYFLQKPPKSVINKIVKAGGKIIHFY